MTDQKYKDLMNGGWSYPKKESTDPEEVKKAVDKYMTDNKIDSETINKKITDGVSKIVADAPEDFDTLKEMSDWISEHEDSAAAMNSAILDNKSGIETLQTSKANATDVETLSGEVETLKTEVNNNTNAISEINDNLDNLSYGETAGGKNLFKIDTTNWTLTDNGIKNNAKNDGYFLGKIKLFAGKTYKISFLLKSKPTVDSSFTAYIDGSVYSPCTFAHFNSYALNVKVENDYTATSDCELLYRLWGNSNSDIFEFQFWVEEGTVSTDYEPYIPSVKMVADDASNINSSMSDYGLNNVFDGVWNQDTDAGKVISNYYSVNSGDTIRIENCSGDAVVLLYNSSKEWQSNINNAVENAVVIPSNISYFRILLSSSVALTPTTADKIRLYINNQIDGLIMTKTFIESIATSSSPAVSGQDYDISTSVYIDGYKAIGIINARIMNNYCSKFHIYGFNVDSSSTANIRTRCDVSGVSSEDLATEFTVLYVKQ